MTAGTAPQRGKDIPTDLELKQEAERVVRSPGFSGSEVLRNLLNFLVRAAIEKSGEPVKEYEIATAVLGRGKDFDPRIDSTVRVHTGRLRSRLAEYYSQEGAADPVRIEIPKGAYHVTCSYWRPGAGASAAAGPPAAATGRRWREWAGWLAAAVAATAAAASWIASQEPGPGRGVRDFWSKFTEGSTETVVVFSNPRFVGTAVGGMRYAPAAPASPSEPVNDRYTGTGEALALHEITRVMTQMHKSMRVKRSQLLTWDEARNQNLLFIGGPDVNLPISDMPRLQQFDFKTVLEEPRLGVGAVINQMPRQGEDKYYFSSLSSNTLDYAVVGLIPGMVPGHRALICAGTMTYGTEAAVEFLLREDGIRALYAALGTRQDAPLPGFEALIKVKVSGGVPVLPELVTVHKRD